MTCPLGQLNLTRPSSQSGLKTDYRENILNEHSTNYHPQSFSDAKIAQLAISWQAASQFIIVRRVIVASENG